MALPPRGLFSPNLDINNLIRQQQKAELSKMDRLKDPGRYYQKQFGDQVTNAVRGIGQALGGASPDSAAGMFASYIKKDPALRAEAQRRTDKDEILAMLDTDGDGQITEKEIKLGSGELLKRGYPNEASKFLQLSTTLGTDRREDEKVALTAGDLTLKQNMFKWEKKFQGQKFNADQNYRELQDEIEREKIDIAWDRLEQDGVSIKKQGEIAYAKLDYEKHKLGKTRKDQKRALDAEIKLKKLGYDIDLLKLGAPEKRVPPKMNKSDLKLIGTYLNAKDGKLWKQVRNKLSLGDKENEEIFSTKPNPEATRIVGDAISKILGKDNSLNVLDGLKVLAGITPPPGGETAKKAKELKDKNDITNLISEAKPEV